MKTTLSNLIVFGQMDNDTLFRFENCQTPYRYVGHVLDELSNGTQKMLVIAYNYAKYRYETLDCGIGTKLYKKNVEIL